MFLEKWKKKRISEGCCTSGFRSLPFSLSRAKLSGHFVQDTLFPGNLTVKYGAEFLTEPFKASVKIHFEVLKIISLNEKNTPRTETFHQTNIN